MNVFSLANSNCGSKASGISPALGTYGVPSKPYSDTRKGGCLITTSPFLFRSTEAGPGCGMTMSDLLLCLSSAESAPPPAPLPLKGLWLSSLE